MSSVKRQILLNELDNLYSDFQDGSSFSQEYSDDEFVRQKSKNEPKEQDTIVDYDTDNRDTQSLFDYTIDCDSISTYESFSRTKKPLAYDHEKFRETLEQENLNILALQDVLSCINEMIELDNELVSNALLETINNIEHSVSYNTTIVPLNFMPKRKSAKSRKLKNNMNHSVSRNLPC